MNHAAVIPVAHEAQEEVACPMCGERSSKLVLYARDRLFAKPGAYRIVECSHCDLRYLSPRPTLDALGEHYPSSYFIYRTVDELPALTRPMARAFSKLRWRESIERLERVRGDGPLKPGVRVVDIGCGLNDYLVTLKELRGVEGIGVDFKPELATYAREKLGMTVHAGTLRSIGFDDGAFDVVSMNEYLEHEPNPREVLEEARRITRPGGFLTLEVPCIESLPARLFGTRWSQVDAPRHLVHFTRETLSEMLRRTGWELVETKTFGIPYVIGFSVLHALGYNSLGRLTAWERALAMLVSLPFFLVFPFVDEFRYAIARAK